MASTTASLDVAHLQRNGAPARADVGPGVVSGGDSPERCELSVALEDASFEDEDACITALSPVDELLDDRVAVLQHRLGHLREVGLVGVLDHEDVSTLGSVEGFDDGVTDGAHEPLDRVGVPRHQ